MTSDESPIPLWTPHVTVFLSSTWNDLQEERAAVRDALHRLKAIKYIGMEYFGSRTEAPLRASIDEVKSAQIFILILGGRYGTGITEAEYECARHPKLIYFKKPEAIQIDDCDNDPRLSQFKAKLIHSHTIANFSNPPELANLVMADLSNWLFYNYIPQGIQSVFRGALPEDRKTALIQAVFSSIRDLRACNDALLAQLEAAGILTPDFSEKLLKYVADLPNDPEFAPLNRRGYFELSLRFMLRTLKRSEEATVSDRKEKYTFDQAIEKFERFVVIGEPGSGKTTALKHLALTYAAAFGKTIGQGKENTNPIPVYVWLPCFNQTPGTSYERLTTLIREAFQKNKTIEFTTEDQKLLLHNFRLVLLLDGLNEVGDDNIARVEEGLRTLEAKYPQHQTFIASRSYNFNFVEDDVHILELLELDYPAEVKKYIECYLEDCSQIERLMDLIESSFSLRRLAVNPLLLYMIILVFQHESTLPKSRGMLLNQGIRGLLGDWKLPVPGRREYWSEDKHLILTYLGFAMRQKGLEMRTDEVKDNFRSVLTTEYEWFSSRNDLRPDGFKPPNRSEVGALIEKLEQDHILFQSADAQSVRIWHQVIQEYFAASYIWNEIWPLFEERANLVRLTRTARKSLEKKLAVYIDDPRWHETLAIVSGLIQCRARGNDTAQIATNRRAAHQMTVAYIDRIWNRNRLLAAMCVSNAENFNDEVKLSSYLKELRQSIYLWASTLPRIYPWILLLSVLTPVWLLPWPQIARSITAAEHWVGLTHVNAQLLNILATISVAGFLTVGFFRLLAAGIKRFESFSNEAYIRPGLAALRYIRNDESDRLLEELNTYIADDFSVGEVTRATIVNGLDDQLRTETELLGMLEVEHTRPQAIRRLFELDSKQGIQRIRQLVVYEDIDSLSFTTAVKELIHLEKRRTSSDDDRMELEQKLRKVHKDRGAGHSKQLAAYHALKELDIEDIQYPGMRLVVGGSIIVLVLAVVILMLLLR